MKTKFLFFFIFISSLLFGQVLITKNILSINTNEKNIKTILFKKQTLRNAISFLLLAENQSSKDITKCKWITSLSKEELIFFVDALEHLKTGSSLENSFFNFVFKKNKIKIDINDVKCTSEHKTYYFQKSCKRHLSFVIHKNQVPKMLSALKAEINEINYVSK